MQVKAETLGLQTRFIRGTYLLLNLAMTLPQAAEELWLITLLCPWRRESFQDDIGLPAEPCSDAMLR